MTDRYKELAKRSIREIAEKKRCEARGVDEYIYTRQRAISKRKRNPFGYKYVLKGQV